MGEGIFSLKNKNIVLTGGLGNLGCVMAQHLAAFGARVFIADVADDAPDWLSDGMHCIKCDLSDAISVQSLFEQVKSLGGSLDALVNNAAYGGGAGGKKAATTRLEDFDDERWALGLDGTVGVTFRCIRESIPYFHGKGSSVNIASMYGTVAPDHAIYGDTGQNSPVSYGAGKAGVIQLTRYCASYLAAKGIRVNCITPGPFPKITPDSDMDFIAKLNGKTMLGRTGMPDELAGPLILLASDASSYMTGANIVVDGGWTAW
jgi:gluconate 5-dehydrogenase